MRDLEKRPGYGLMDFCLAFDLFAEAQHIRLLAGERPSAASWFGSTSARHLNVAQSVMATEGDAAARLLDLRRLAAETAQRANDPIAASLTLPTGSTPTAPPAAIAASARTDQLTVQLEPAIVPADAAPLPAPIPASQPQPQRARVAAVEAAPPPAPRSEELTLESQLLDVVGVAPAADTEPVEAVEPLESAPQ